MSGKYLAKSRATLQAKIAYAPGVTGGGQAVEVESVSQLPSTYSTALVGRVYKVFIGTTDLTEEASNILMQADPFYWAYDSVNNLITCNIQSSKTADHLTRMERILADGLGVSSLKPPINQSAVTVTAPANTVLPTVSGVHTSTNVQTAAQGTWSGSPTIAFTFQWMRDGVAIAGATAATYTLAAPADVGHAIKCRVTGTSPFGSSFADSASFTPAS